MASFLTIFRSNLVLSDIVTASPRWGPSYANTGRYKGIVSKGVEEAPPSPGARRGGFNN